MPRQRTTKSALGWSGRCATGSQCEAEAEADHDAGVFGDMTVGHTAAAGDTAAGDWQTRARIAGLPGRERLWRQRNGNTAASAATCIERHRDLTSADSSDGAAGAGADTAVGLDNLSW